MFKKLRDTDDIRFQSRSFSRDENINMIKKYAEFD